ncbi:hypothetical protein [Nocardioides albertanoniae]|uniref:hypothetical protein n=1 Tax=Nocardioides albertanoniae TaxID=1175486 RepID=UPI00115305F2|nr:hypothetical protein [Nocardioides albertanoniae]
MRSVMLAVGRGWLFGILLGLVLGGGLGTFVVPVVGTVFGGVAGVVVGALAGLPAAVLVAPAALLGPSVFGDRVWPGAVATGAAYLLVTEVVFAGSDMWDGDNFVYLLVLVVIAGALGVCFGGVVVRGVRILSLRTPRVAVCASLVGAAVGAWRVVTLEGLGEPGLLLGVSFLGWIVGGILGSVLIIFNLLVTKEPAAE